MNDFLDGPTSTGTSSSSTGTFSTASSIGSAGIGIGVEGAATTRVRWSRLPSPAPLRGRRAGARSSSRTSLARPMGPDSTTASISSVPLRPRRSESQLQVNAPITAPSRMLAAITCFQPSAMPKSLVICSRAPEMMPVS